MSRSIAVQYKQIYLQLIHKVNSRDHAWLPDDTFIDRLFTENIFVTLRVDV